jgi:alpha-beta hydrolase superfamily lysophospholipase
MKHIATCLAFSLLCGITLPNTFALAASNVPVSQPSVNIPVSSWADPNVTPRAVMVCIHGLGLHKGNYEDFGKRLAEEGIITYAMDVRGFGEWQKYKQYRKVDLKGALNDLNSILTAIKTKYPDLPIILTGESMGGAFALHGAALNQDKVAGLICSVPSGDRYRGEDDELHIALNAIFRGFDANINVGKMVVRRSTTNEKLRQEWKNDPLARMEFSPNELMQFQSFMKQNEEMAHLVQKSPVLFVQGGKDNLVLPAGTFALKKALGTANSQFVLSGSSEHLLFESNQFNDKIVAYVLAWIDKNVTPLPDSRLAMSAPDTVASVRDNPQAPDIQIASNKEKEKPVENTPQDTVAMANPADATSQAPVSNAGISYWIELKLGGKRFRCNSRTAFKSGDEIRFHVIPEVDGYAYVVLKQGTSGSKAVLYPPANQQHNILRADSDYPLPYEGWLAFDNTPGIEKLSLVFSRQKVDTNHFTNDRIEVAYIGETGSKDIVPTRMKLSFDSEAPNIISADVAETTSIAQNSNKRSNMTRLVCLDTGVLAVDIALHHH